MRKRLIIKEITRIPRKKTVFLIFLLKTINFFYVEYDKKRRNPYEKPNNEGSYRPKEEIGTIIVRNSIYIYVILEATPKKNYQEYEKVHYLKEKSNPFGDAKPRDERLYIVNHNKK